MKILMLQIIFAQEVLWKCYVYIQRDHIIWWSQQLHVYAAIFVMVYKSNSIICICYLVIYFINRVSLGGILDNVALCAYNEASLTNSSQSWTIVLIGFFDARSLVPITHI